MPSPSRRGRLVYLTLLAWPLLLAAEPPRPADAESAKSARTAWTTSRVVGTPDPPPPFKVVRAFPNLKDYVVTSRQNPGHNCVAFAAGDTTLWWEPLKVPDPGFYWPPGAFRGNDNDGETCESLHVFSS